MRKISTLIIDDESANLNVLFAMLKKYCPNLDVKGLANSADEGYELIREQKPELVFLDIKMPGKNGFDLLRMFSSIDFQVIFVSGFDQYAIQAFEFSAIGYILKPIDHTRLTAAVSKAEELIRQKNNDNIIHFIHSMDEKTQLIKNISLHQNDKVHIIDIVNISYVQAVRGYSEIVTGDGERFISAKSLADYEEFLSVYPNFLRVSKSIIVNSDFIKDYTKGANCFITVKNYDLEIEVSRRKKTSILASLKHRF